MRKDLLDAMTEALNRIAFQKDCSAIAGNPGKWPCTIAYKALGGEIKEGVRVLDEQALLNQLAQIATWLSSGSTNDVKLGEGP